jgi:hypothetical protein
VTAITLLLFVGFRPAFLAAFYRCLATILTALDGGPAALFAALRRCQFGRRGGWRRVVPETEQGIVQYTFNIFLLISHE